MCKCFFMQPALKYKGNMWGFCADRWVKFSKVIGLEGRRKKKKKPKCEENLILLYRASPSSTPSWVLAKTLALLYWSDCFLHFWLLLWDFIHKFYFLKYPARVGDYYYLFIYWCMVFFARLSFHMLWDINILAVFATLSVSLLISGSVQLDLQWLLWLE